MRLALRRQVGQVADAADVLHGAAALLVAEQQQIEVGDQRRALAAAGDVARPKVGGDGAARALGDLRRRAELER